MSRATATFCRSRAGEILIEASGAGIGGGGDFANGGGEGGGGAVIK